jgi:hypothetical protein
MALAAVHTRLVNLETPSYGCPPERKIMSHTYGTIRQLTKMLRNLDAWLQKGIEHAQEKKFDPANLLQARLAPDQFALLRQVQAACDAAKFAAARPSGKQAPVHEDTETTFEEVRARLRSCVEYLDGYSEADFKGADERVVTLRAVPGKALSGADYLTEFAVPNFYFHVTTAYAILRHNGVSLGKMDFLGPLNMKDA